MGHRLVDCGDRGLRVDMGRKVATNCGDRGLQVAKGHEVGVIQGRGAFVSFSKGTTMNYWGTEVVDKGYYKGSSKSYQSKKHGNQSLEEAIAMSGIQADEIKTFSWLAGLFTGIIEHRSIFLIKIGCGTGEHCYYN